VSSLSPRPPHGFSLPGVVVSSSRRFPERKAIVDGEVVLTYRELAELARRATRALMAAGVQAGDRVSVWSPNTYHWIVATLAIHGARATLVPLNTRYTGVEASDILERTGARVLFVPDEFLGADYLVALRAAERDSDEAERADGRGARARVSGGDTVGLPVPSLPDLELVVRVPVRGVAPRPEPGVIAWDAWLARADEVSEEDAARRTAAVSADDVSDILFTSGTTGRPKGAMSAHRQTIAVAEAWAERAEVTEDDVYLVISPFFHSFGYKAGLLVCLLTGATIVPQLVFDVDAVLAQVERERVTILPGPPTIFQTLLAHPERAERNLSSLRLAVTGSAMVPVALIERMRRDLTFQTIITAYGLSEAVVVTMCHPGDDPETISRTSGCATADFEVRIADLDGNVLPPGAEGEIQLRGPNVMLGYLDDPAATHQAVEPDGWLHTGDVGYLDERGYLTITDRLKDMFTVGGFNVYPAEVEGAILRLDDVVECAVVGVPDERLGEVGRAYVVARPGHALCEEDVLAVCRERLANFKMPRSIELVDALPHNAAGKVLKQELRARARARARS
jgi:acyl-CoA synthetase (AMP-forming)/AMP-acid ligase II